MIYTASEISISRAVQILDNNRNRLLKKNSWLPVFNLKKHIENFRVQFNELFNETKIRSLFKTENHKMILVNKINNTLPALYYGLLLSDDPMFKEHFKQLFGREPKSMEDYKRVTHEIARLRRKLKNIDTGKSEQSNNEGVKLGELVASVESILGISIDRSLSLLEFKYQYELANRKVNELKKLKN